MNYRNNHYSYRVCRGRNMQPFYSYEKRTQTLSGTILVKWGPGPYCTEKTSKVQFYVQFPEFKSMYSTTSFKNIFSLFLKDLVNLFEGESNTV